MDTLLSLNLNIQQNQTRVVTTGIQCLIAVKTRVVAVFKDTFGHSPGRVDPHDANVAEENTLFVFLVLTRAAFLSTVGRVVELHHGALLRTRAWYGAAFACKY